MSKRGLVKSLIMDFDSEPKKTKSKFQIEINEFKDIEKLGKIEYQNQIAWNLANYPSLTSIFPKLPKSIDTLEICNDYDSEKMVIPDQITTLQFNILGFGRYSDQDKQIIVPTYCFVKGVEDKYILRGNYNNMTDDEKLTFLIKNNAYDFDDEIIELFNQKLKPNQENLYLSIINKNDKHFELCIEFGCKLDNKAFQLSCRKKYAKAINLCLKNGFQITENEINLIIPTKNK